MGKIRLEGMDFFAFHGFYEEERKIGNKYSITLQVETDFKEAAENDDLSGTINYEELYEIVREVMALSYKLLEHVGQQIIGRIQSKFGVTTKVEIWISKHNPPLGGICGSSTIIMNEQDLE